MFLLLQLQRLESKVATSNFGESCPQRGPVPQPAFAAPAGVRRHMPGLCFTAQFKIASFAIKQCTVSNGQTEAPVQLAPGLQEAS